MFKKIMSSLALIALINSYSSTRATAQEKDETIRTGDFEGLWHGAKAAFSIQEVHDNKTFDGIAMFTEGRYAGLKFGIHGRLGKDNSLVLTRYVAGEKQTARAGAPMVLDCRLVWSGETEGIGLRQGVPWPFELGVPKR